MLGDSQELATSFGFQKRIDHCCALPGNAARRLLRELPQMRGSSRLFALIRVHSIRRNQHLKPHDYALFPTRSANLIALLSRRTTCRINGQGDAHFSFVPFASAEAKERCTASFARNRAFRPISPEDKVPGDPPSCILKTRRTQDGRAAGQQSTQGVWKARADLC